VTKVRNAIVLQLVLVLQRRGLRDLGREEGQTLAEYALILGVIAVLVIGAVLFLSGRIQSVFSQLGNAL
jgi:Flp pilus assembly pilin Flp